MSAGRARSEPTTSSNDCATTRWTTTTRHIDWRATARRNKLTVKDFQASQSQRLIFLIDCGRMMTNLAAGLSLLDHSLNAMLMLSYVALQKGDSVGMIAFSERIHCVRAAAKAA